MGGSVRDVRLARGKRGFTFTHKPVVRSGLVDEKTIQRNRDLIKHANDNGFVINLSADNLDQADRYKRLGVGPVTVVLPMNASSKAFKTKEGHTVIVCPAERTGIQCVDCKLCAIPTRKCIVGFRAHGAKKRMVSELVQIGRKSKHGDERLVEGAATC